MILKKRHKALHWTSRAIHATKCIYDEISVWLWQRNMSHKLWSGLTFDMQKVSFVALMVWFGSVFVLSPREGVLWCTGLCLTTDLCSWAEWSRHSLQEVRIAKGDQGVSLFLVALNSQLHPGWLETSALSLHMDTHVGAPVELNGPGCTLVICYLTL